MRTFTKIVSILTVGAASLVCGLSSPASAQDLDCDDPGVGRNFPIDPNNDPHRLDGDNDGIACEGGGPSGDLDCDSPGVGRSFAIDPNNDPHRLDGDNDGIACEGGGEGMSTATTHAAAPATTVTPVPHVTPAPHVAPSAPHTAPPAPSPTATGGATGHRPTLAHTGSGTAATAAVGASLLALGLAALLMSRPALRRRHPH